MEFDTLHPQRPLGKNTPGEKRYLDIHLISMFDCDTRSYLARVEALDDDAVLVELVLGLHPLRLALFSGQGMDYGLTVLR